MTNRSSVLRHTIADVERDTGLSKDTLRVWERRYGFPNPERDPLGERQYDDDQLLRLRHLRRLLDAGHRPGQVVALPLDVLLTLHPPGASPSPASPAVATTGPHAATVSPQASAPRRQATDPLTAAVSADTGPDLGHWLQLLRQHDAAGLRVTLEQYLHRHGLLALMRDGIAPLNARVGQAWLDGQLAVFEEHLYTETVQGLLRHAMGQLMAGQRRQPPRVLLTTVPGEPHSLGLLMAESVMVLEGCETVGLGVQTPLPDIVAAASACRADVVALGFTALQNPRDVRNALARLREQLPPALEIWAGGQCPVLYRPVRGAAAATLPAFWPMAQLDDIVLGIARWRAHNSPDA